MTSTRFPHRYNQAKIDPSAFIAPGAQVVGDVQIGKDASIWHNAVLRGDVHYLRVGDRTNIQDLSLLHASYETYPTIVGTDVTIGHSCIIHACTIGNFVLIGMGSIVMDGAEVGDFSIIGAGSLVTQRTKIPAYSKAFGRPAKVVGKLTEEEIEHLKWSADHYVHLAKTYK